MNFLTAQIGCEMKNQIWHATLVVFTIMLPISTIGHARAHDYQHPELNSWYESLHSGKGPAAMAAMRSALMTPIGKLMMITIAGVLMASGLIFRTTLSWMDRTALAIRWSG